MKLKSVVICTALSLGLALLATLGFPSRVTARKAAAAGERLEVLAFEKEGNPELQSVVSDLREANKHLYVEGAIQWLLQVLSAGSSAGALSVCLWKTRNAEPSRGPSKNGVLGMYPLR
ncbi:MAG TPA: hypothetical protein PK322_05565 [Opitutaceae bacterium]|nr:hypothetical protein [Opitutaceae bacterium]